MERRRWRSLVPLVLCSTIVIACERSGRSSDEGVMSSNNSDQRHQALPEPETRDSSGTRLIEYGRLSPMPPAWETGFDPLRFNLSYLPAAFIIESQPYLDLGGLRQDARQEFDASHAFLSATVLQNNTIVVNDRTSLKFFTRAGVFLREAGRKGRGPGEFQQTRKVCRLPGDTLLVFDFIGDRTTLWDSEGEHIETYQRVSRFRGGSCDSTGAMVVRDADSATTVNSRGDLVASYHLLRPDGSLVRRLGTLPTTLFSGGVSREPSIIPVGSDLYVGNARVWEVSVQRADGTVRRVTRFTGDLVRVLADGWQNYAESKVPGDATASQRAMLKSITSQRSFDFWPAFSRMLVDPVGRTWVLDFGRFDEWTVLDSNGVIMGRFQTPGAGLGSRTGLVGVGADHIILREYDGAGAAHLRFYRIAEMRAPDS